MIIARASQASFGRRLAPVTAALTLAAVGVGWAGARPDARAQTADAPSPCAATLDVSVEPWGIVLGETVEVVASTTLGCPTSDPAAHVVIVLDGAEAAAGPLGQEQLSAARAFLKQLDLRAQAGIAVGVVFGADAEQQCALSNNASRVSGCIGRADAVGPSSWSDRLAAARDVLVAGRDALPAGSAAPLELIVFLATGVPSPECVDVLMAARSLRDEGVAFLTACVGPTCDATCLAMLASSPQDAIASNDPGNALAMRTQAIIARTARPIVQNTTLRHVLPPDVAYVEGSASPSPSEIGSGGRLLVWRMAFVPPDGVTLAYRLQPSTTGPVDLGVFDGTFADSAGRAGTVGPTNASAWVFADRVPSDPAAFFRSLHAFFPIAANGSIR